MTESVRSKLQMVQSIIPELALTPYISVFFEAFSWVCIAQPPEKFKRKAGELVYAFESKIEM